MTTRTESTTSFLDNLLSAEIDKHVRRQSTTSQSDTSSASSQTGRNRTITAAANNNEADGSSESRYQRQADLLSSEGWDQRKLQNCRVAVIGSDCLANYAVLTLSAFGFGNIELYSQGIVPAMNTTNYSPGFLYWQAQPGEAKSLAVEKRINRINPEINIRGIRLEMDRAENTSILAKPDIIIDASNDPTSKLTIADYGFKERIPVISMSAGTTKGGVGIFHNTVKTLENLLFTGLENQPQDPVISQIIAGIGVEEARKIINPMRGEKPLEDMIVYNLNSPQRFDNTEIQTSSQTNIADINKLPDLSKHSVCLIGAGALGNFVALGLALRNIGKLRIIDYDTTEITNLNRQILLYDGVGQQKASVLVERLKRINPRGDYEAVNSKIVPGSDSLVQGYDLIMDTVDNNKTRALLNHFSVQYEIPFISGGTRYNSGQVNVCIPGYTPCLNCQADIDNLARGTAERARQQSQSCIYAAQPSVITSNQITGGLMVGEATKILDQKYGPYVHGELKYVSNEEFRVKLLPTAKDQCDCHTKKEDIKNWLSTMQGVYETAR